MRGRQEVDYVDRYQGHYHAAKSKNIAADEGSLLETVISIVVLSIAAFMLINFTFVSTKAERRFALRDEALNTLEDYSAGFRGIDCIQHFERLKIPCSNNMLSNRPSPSIINPDIRDIAEVNKGSGGTGHALIAVEWKDYYWLEDCNNPEDNDIPRAVREITVSWDDGSGVEDKSFTRLINGPTIPHHWGWVAEYDSSTTLNLGDYNQELWHYELTSTATQNFWSTTYTVSNAGTIAACSILVGPGGKYERQGTPATTCLIGAPRDIYNTATPPVITRDKNKWAHNC